MNSLAQSPIRSRFRESFEVGGTWSVECDSRELLDQFAKVLPPAVTGSTKLKLVIQESEREGCQLWDVPLFRGREHLMVAAYGPNDAMLVDLKTATAIATASREAISNCEFWGRTFLPILLGVAAPSVGVTPIHAAALQYRGDGILISGESGAGKSTLTAALSERGFEYISDDWTYLARRGGYVAAWALPCPIKLMPDARRFFPALEMNQPLVWSNGEPAIPVDPTRAFGTKSIRETRIRRIFLLKREGELEFRVSRIRREDAAAELTRTLEELTSCLAPERLEQIAMIRELTDGAECYELRCSGAPQEIAASIERFCEVDENGDDNEKAMTIAPRPEWPDMLRRRVPAPSSRLVRIGESVVNVAFEDEAGTLLAAAGTHSGEPNSARWELTVLRESAWSIRATQQSMVHRQGHLGLAIFGKAGLVAIDRATRSGFACLGSEFFSSPEAATRFWQSFAALRMERE